MGGGRLEGRGRERGEGAAARRRGGEGRRVCGGGGGVGHGTDGRPAGAGGGVAGAGLRGARVTGEEADRRIGIAKTDDWLQRITLEYLVDRQIDAIGVRGEVA